MDEMDIIEQGEAQTLSEYFIDGKLNTCEVCGNQYDKCFGVHMRGEVHVFDSFECAIHALAPRCSHCGCTILGHGMESNGVMYCCANCARQHGIHQLEDRAESVS